MIGLLRLGGAVGAVIGLGLVAAYRMGRNDQAEAERNRQEFLRVVDEGLKARDVELGFVGVEVDDEPLEPA